MNLLLLFLLDIKEYFKLFDEDESGYISTDELLKMLQCMKKNPNPAEIIVLLEKFDADSKYVLKIFYENTFNPF